MFVCKHLLWESCALIHAVVVLLHEVGVVCHGVDFVDVVVLGEMVSVFSVMECFGRL